MSLKKNLLSLFILVTFLCGSSFPSEIHFNSPHNGEIISNTYYSDQVSVNISWGYTPNPALLISRIILETGDKTYEQGGSSQIPQWLYLKPGTYTWTLRLIEGVENGYETASATVTFEVDYSVAVKNNFPAGSIMVDGVSRPSGYGVKRKIGESFSASAVDQIYNGYNMTWNTGTTKPSNWTKQLLSGVKSILPGETSRDISYTVYDGDNGASVISDLRKICSVNVLNNMSGNTDLGTVYVNDVQQASNSATTVVEGDQLKLTAISSYDYDNMHYTFNHWENNSTSATRYVSPVINSNYTAFFKGTPIYSTTDRNLNVTNAVGTSPQLTWNEHQNPLVTGYDIWRKILKGPNANTGEVIARVSRGTLSYTDGDYYNNGTSLQDMLFYNVSAYCSSENTFSTPYWTGIYYGILIKGVDSTNISQMNITDKLDNSLSNYPNPFNPSTQIRYSIMENSFVTLQVYDILGNKVAELVNEYKPAGKYSVNFDASNKPSGIYICTIKANNYTSIKKMLLVK